MGSSTLSRFSRPVQAPLITTVIGGILFLAPHFASSLDPIRNPDQYVRRSWDRADGLPQASVTAIAQDRLGHLWLGTFGGLARFDGVSFEVFALRTSQAYRATESSPSRRIAMARCGSEPRALESGFSGTANSGDSNLKTGSRSDSSTCSTGATETHSGSVAAADCSR